MYFRRKEHVVSGEIQGDRGKEELEKLKIGRIEHTAGRASSCRRLLFGGDRLYIYPDHLKSKATLWLWQLRDIGILGICGLVSILAATQRDLCSLVF